MQLVPAQHMVAAGPNRHVLQPMPAGLSPHVQVREADKAYREARSAVRSAEKLLLDPPPTDKLVLHVSRLAGQGLE